MRLDAMILSIAPHRVFNRGTREPQILATMKTLRRYITVPAAITFLTFIIPAVAGDLGNPKDVQQVRKVVAKKFGKVLHVSVSHD